ncbi:uncharacterized protein PAC_11606 [Phialocephala subalpina]|uniref:Uncharacterized protein n=1 Tax=Phialocephala subalpina TaxID=576137 RepID=A0A1L7X9K6_9HELO|nr:uncharacterized protein PAC_11606 [Phialocephala subalpina]
METSTMSEWTAETLTEHLLAKFDSDNTTSNARKLSRVQEHRSKQLTRVIHNAFPFWRDYRQLVQRLYQLSKVSWSTESKVVKDASGEKGLQEDHGGHRKRGVKYPELRGGLIKTFKLLGQFEAAQTLRLRAAKGFALVGGRFSLEAAMLSVVEDSLSKIARVNGLTGKEVDTWVGATETSKLLRQLRPDNTKTIGEAVWFMVEFLLPQVTTAEYNAEMANLGYDRGEKGLSSKGGSAGGFQKTWDRNAQLYRPEVGPGGRLPTSSFGTRTTEILRVADWR